MNMGTFDSTDLDYLNDRFEPVRGNILGSQEASYTLPNSEASTIQLWL